MITSRKRQALRDAMARYEQDLDGAVTRPIEYLLRGLARAEVGRHNDAANDARLAAPDPSLAVPAAQLLYIAGRHGEGIDLLAGIDAQGARRLRARLCASLGWTLDALEAVQDGLRAMDDALPLRLEALRICGQAGADDAALAHAEAAYAEAPGHASLALELAGLLARRGDDRHAEAERVLLSVPDAARTEPFLLEGAQVLLKAGAHASARSLLLACAALQGELLAAAHAERAHLAFCDGDDSAARTNAVRSLSLDRDQSLAAVVLGALSLEAGDESEAEEKLLFATKNDPESALGVSWLAELYMRSARHNAARDALHRSSTRDDSFMFVLALQRLLLSIRTVERERRLAPHRFREVAEGLRYFDDDADQVMAGGDPASVGALIERVLLRVGRDRRHTPPALRRAGSRGRARRAIQRVVALGDGALAAFDEELGNLTADDALVRCHRGELALWLGRYEEAEQDLRAALAIDRRTRWAWIGLSALAIVRGEPERALALEAEGIEAMDGTVGAAVYAHRGEALRLLGRYDESAVALFTAAQLNPSRASVFLNLSLLAEATGNAELGKAMNNRLARQAPGLMSDARRQASGSDADCLREALRMLGANRSSGTITYRADTPNGPKLRVVPRFSASAFGPASECGRLRARLGLASGPAELAARGDGDEQPSDGSFSASGEGSVEHFVERGYLVLRGGFDPSLAKRWVEAAVRRIRSFPDVFVKGYGRHSPPLWGFDDSDPSTWSWPRIELLAETRVPFDDATPKLWTALRGLLGEKIASRDLSDYLVVNLNEAENEDMRPHESMGWHIDDPGPAMSLKSLKNGVVLIMLFSDCEPGAGGTLLLEGSAQVVAQRLSGAGADMVGQSAGRELAKSLGKVTQVRGRAGDVYICSSLMLHTSAPNPSGRIRWMANPMIYLSEPPRLSGEGLTPFARSLLCAVDEEAPS